MKEPRRYITAVLESPYTITTRGNRLVDLVERLLATMDENKDKKNLRLTSYWADGWSYKLEYDRLETDYEYNKRMELAAISEREIEERTESSRELYEHLKKIYGDV